ncbi:unnamed protein product [Somion occarium]|uniref:Protein kinase domain-containing protein n=1 Tax=Somion occarium TaxID=3059160 RepID=A0ABP1EBT5_9APHY
MNTPRSLTAGLPITQHLPVSLDYDENLGSGSSGQHRYEEIYTSSELAEASTNSLNVYLGQSKSIDSMHDLRATFASYEGWEGVEGTKGPQQRLTGTCDGCKKLKVYCEYGPDYYTCKRCLATGTECIVDGHKGLRPTHYSSFGFGVSSSMPTTSSHEKQQEIDEIYRILLNSLTLDSSINSSTKASLSALKRLCNEHHTLPSGLHLHNVQCLDTALPVTGGSFSDIYIGDMDGSKVALKVLRIYQTTDSAMKQKIKKKFNNEALIWATCQHRFVLPFLGIDSKNFKHAMCMVLPWMEHGRISDNLTLLRSHKHPLGSRGQVNIWLSQIAEGLAYLHAVGIIHGDLRAANVLLDEDYNVKLSDFGLAIIANDTGTQATTVDRTPNWLAPELLLPDKFGSSSSRPTLAGDVYAFGCVAIELYTGKPPFAGLSQFAVISKIMEGVPIPEPTFYNEEEMPSHLWSIVKRCLVQNYKKRPTSAEVAGHMVVTFQDFVDSFSIRDS